MKQPIACEHILLQETLILDNRLCIILKLLLILVCLKFIMSRIIIFAIEQHYTFYDIAYLSSKSRVWYHRPHSTLI